jgi:hypothetical protein
MFTLRETMQPLAAGETAEPPDVAPPVPPPPDGTYRRPVTPPRTQPPSPPPATSSTNFGTLDLRVPPDVDVTIDGQRWATAEEGHFVVRLPAGRHRLELSKPGTFRMGTDVEINEGETSTLELNLKGLRES